MDQPDDLRSLLSEIGVLRQALKSLTAEQHRRDEQLQALWDAVARLENRLRARPAGGTEPAAPAPVPPRATEPPPLPPFPPIPAGGPAMPWKPLEPAAPAPPPSEGQSQPAATKEDGAVVSPPPAIPIPPTGPVPHPPPHARPAPRPVQPAPAPPPPNEDAHAPFEMQIGRVWLVRVGIALLLTGLVLFGNYVHRYWIPHIPPIVRLMVLVGASLGMAVTGARVSRRESTRVFGEVVLAGGMAALYYCAYAAYHVPRLKVIDSPVLGALLLLAAALGMVGVSWARKSQVTATLGIILASYATFLNPLGWMAAFSNLLLAAGGTALLAQAGWQGPGIASLLGTYGSFALWQVFLTLGKREGHDLSVLWFLPATWAVFTVPAVLDRFRESMGEHARAWFAAFNNSAFFLLFAFFWFQSRTDSWPAFWTVPAVFGLVLVALGLLGRRRSQPVGEVNLGQGLAALSLALVLKLEGFHLMLGLAAESLALGLAFARFRRPLEGGFSLLAGWGCLFVFMAIPSVIREAPPWSLGLTALLLALSAAAHRYAAWKAEDSLGYSPRAQSTALLALAAGITVFLWIPVLPPQTHAPTTLALAAALTIGSLALDRRRWWPDLTWLGTIFLLVGAAFLGSIPSSRFSAFVSLLMATGTCVAWHRLVPKKDPETPATWSDPADFPSPHAWLASALVPFAALTWINTHRLPDSSNWWLPGLLTLGLLAAAIGARASRLAVTAQALQAIALVAFLTARAGEESGRALAPAAGALASVLVLVLPPGRSLDAGHRGLAVILARIAFTLYFILGWRLLFPHGFGDILALAALAVMGVAILRRRFVGREEALAFLVVAVLALYARLLGDPWVRLPVRPSFLAGLGVILGLRVFALIVLRLREDQEKPATENLRACVLLASSLAVAAFALWTTQRFVWHWGWGPTAILWSGLGFAYVSAGLALRDRPARLGGFILLGIALLKLFLRDVWQFTTFTRVGAFLALGAALVLLGFFYNRFASKLKEWI